MEPNKEQEKMKKMRKGLLKKGMFRIAFRAFFKKLQLYGAKSQ
jgi:hypothetical protein